MINYMVEIIYMKNKRSRKHVENWKYTIWIYFSWWLYIFGFYDMTDAYRFETLCSDEKFDLKEYNR